MPLLVALMWALVFAELGHAEHRAAESPRGPGHAARRGELDSEQLPRRTTWMDRTADQLTGHQPLEIVHGLDRRAVDLHDQVFGAEAPALGRSVGGDFDDLDTGPAELARDAVAAAWRRVRCRRTPCGSGRPSSATR